MNFLNRFENFLRNELNIHSPQKILVAVSGGVDSMVLLNILLQTKHQIAVAHCNFGLRGEESDADQKFVELFCAKNKIYFHVKKFNIEKYSFENKTGVQESARALRYHWFNELSIDYQYNFIATAHHLNDVTETLLFNITRGTGISGLHGIPKKNEQIIRPLLFANKEEIIAFANSSNISFRNDSSNKKNSYSRNKIRNQIIPLLKEINPLLEEHVHALTSHMSFVENIYRKHLEDTWNKIHQTKNDIIEINIPDLTNLPDINFYLFEFLKPFGFNFYQVADIILSFKEQSGKQFYSSSHFLVKDRESLFIHTLLPNSHDEVLIKKDDTLIHFNNFILKIDTLKVDKPVIYSSKDFYLDMDTILFPLKISTWNHSDKFYPLGMNDSKKISDFFIDEKINLINKSKAVICRSGDGNIICVLPYRIDNRNKITAQTKNILKITVLPS